MVTYEYKIVGPYNVKKLSEENSKAGKKPAGFEELFNKLGSDGWELVSKYDNTNFIFRKVKNEQV